MSVYGLNLAANFGRSVWVAMASASSAVPGVFALVNMILLPVPAFVKSIGITAHYGGWSRLFAHFLVAGVVVGVGHECSDGNIRCPHVWSEVLYGEGGGG